MITLKDTNDKEMYQWLFRKNGFKVSNEGFFISMVSGMNLCLIAIKI